MLQVYFLSIFLNVLAGYLLISKDNGGALEFKSSFNLKDDTSRLVIGILSALTGLFKLLSPIEGDIPVIGDLVPAAAGLFSGFILIFEYYRSRSSIAETEQTEKINRIFIGNKKLIGFASLIAAVLHFIFPRVLLL